MLRVFGYDITRLTEKEFSTLYQKASKDRKRRVARSKSDIAKKRIIASGALMHYAASKYLGTPIKNSSFAATETGKPYLPDQNLHISLTHSGSLVLCAVSDSPVGIDAEKLRPVNPGVKEKYFTEKERMYIESDASKRDARFFEIWTKKEAYVKMLGTGLFDIKNFDVTEKDFTTKHVGDYIISVTTNEDFKIKYIEKWL